jgi:hypothetical protein
MAGFLFLLVFFVAGSIFGPVQYHPGPMDRPPDIHGSANNK